MWTRSWLRPRPEACRRVVWLNLRLEGASVAVPAQLAKWTTNNATLAAKDLQQARDSSLPTGTPRRPARAPCSCPGAEQYKIKTQRGRVPGQLPQDHDRREPHRHHAAPRPPLVRRAAAASWRATPAASRRPTPSPRRPSPTPARARGTPPIKPARLLDTRHRGPPRQGEPGHRPGPPRAGRLLRPCRPALGCPTASRPTPPP